MSVENWDFVKVTAASAASHGVTSKRVSSSTPLRSVASLTPVVPSSPLHTVSLARCSCHNATDRSQRRNSRARAPSSRPSARASGVTAGCANTPRTSFE